MGFSTRIKFIKRFENYEMYRDKTSRLTQAGEGSRFVINRILIALGFN